MKVMQSFRSVQSLGAYVANTVGIGQSAEAHAVAQELLKLDPRFCIRHIEDVFPVKSAELRGTLASTFRSAGLPE